MSEIKTSQVRINIEQSNMNWLLQMERRGVSRTALVNLAIDILKPRLNNIQTTETAIAETLIRKTVEENLEY
jgi:hypothetical protein